MRRKMKKKYKNGLVVSLTTAALLTLCSSSFSAHLPVPLQKWVVDGDPASGAMAIGQFDAYSPRATCGGCHTQSFTDVDDGTDAGQAYGSYDGGGTTKEVVKTQGIMNEGTGDVEWVSYNVTAYEHGFVVGRHSQQGRNEDYGNHLRHNVHGKFWASSPGMFGKY
jgi:hypothetical protein